MPVVQRSVVESKRLLAVDTETTGVDLRHGAKPYFVGTCDNSGTQLYWEWDVDPLTREPIIPPEDVAEIESVFSEYDGFILQNPKFDVAALATIGVRWPSWAATYDTLLAGHLLASNHPHDLTSMALEYLQVNLQPFDDALKVACVAARSMARTRFKDWRIAKPGLPEMPSAKASVWKYDAWLPRALAKQLGHDEDHPWWSVLSQYALADPVATYHLFRVMEYRLKKRNLWRIYEERLKVLPIVYKMEQRGVTISGERLNSLRTEYRAESERLKRLCTSIAASYDHELVMPKSGANNSLRELLYNKMHLPLIVDKKTKSPSLNKAALGMYQETLKPNSKPLTFINALKRKRLRDTADSYMDSYERYWLPWVPVDVDPVTGAGWYVLHPSLNPTGTDTLRWSSSNPNEQNISKQEGFNLRYCFGPAPGREWWSLDAKNIELRLPAYEAGETEMIALFEHPDDPPYYGSNHLLVFDILHPELFAKHGAVVKKLFASTWYQWTKNGNFAVQYGAMEESGTADRAYHMPGAQRRIQERFSNITKLNQRMIEMANRLGYVETMPDKTVDPERGYPLLCTRSAWGKILPTVPLNYHIQGTAMWWMMKAMIRCQAYLDELNERLPQPTYFMIMQVHDELVFDFPKGQGPEPWKTNLPKMRRIRRLMEQSGDDIGVPTPVSCEYHSDNWSEGISV